MKKISAFCGVFLGSVILNLSLQTIQAQSWSWQKPHATVLPNGDLQWAPETFVFTPGASVRYIDFEGGDDAASGTTTTTAWKHHPWDPAATGNSLACTGIQTYVFKRGVIYRGTLSAKQGGVAGNPIRLTSDPAWGTGEAMFFGSQRISGGWTQADATSAPGIPNPGKVWYIDLSPAMVSTKMVAEMIGDSMVRIPLARTPNWKLSNTLDPMAEWWTWTGLVGGGTAAGYRIDTMHFKQSDPAYWVGGHVWSEYDGIMGTMWGEKILSYDPATRSIKTNTNQGGAGFRYYIENLPQLLDTTNEYFFDKSGSFPGRLYIRLAGEKDPNTAIIEVADKGVLIRIAFLDNIEISDLSFAFTTHDQIHWTAHDVYNMKPVVQLVERCINVKVTNCKFTYVNAGVTIQNAPGAADVCHDITISDNLMNHIDDQAITCGSNSNDYMDNIYILRNKIYDNGGRQLCRGYSFVPAITGQLRSGEVAGNIIELSYGSGINMFWGKSDGDSTRSAPLIRGMVHHNRADKTLLALNDYGGIESWQGGPAYFYNNYSVRARGLKMNGVNADYNPWGFPYYFDGGFKHYCFNNIAVGPGNSLTDKTQRYRAAFQQVLGFHNIYANNTAYNFVYGFTVQGHSGSTPAYNCFLGNVLDNISKRHFNNGDLLTSQIPYESYGYNILGKTVQDIGSFSDMGVYITFADFKNALAGKKAMLSQTGWETSSKILEDPANNDLRLAGSSAAIDHGVKVFIPFSLYAVVGEWHFFRCQDYTKVPGSNFYFTTEYGARAGYLNQPKNHLTASGVNHTSYVNGLLEDWTEGALEFKDTTYCFLPDADLKKKVATNLDMEKESFLIEVYTLTMKGHTDGVIVSKYAEGGSGYILDIDPAGHARMRVRMGGADVYARSSTAAVNDSSWHHIIAEVDRVNWLVNIYVDGKLSNGTATGDMPEVYESLTNTGDFIVGKCMDGFPYRGSIDFLRVSKGMLKDAKTTIEELYAWEFNGPFLKDFAGNAPQGKRDAGAIEKGRTDCDLSVTPTSLDYIEYKSTKTLTVNPGDEFRFHVSASWLTPSEKNGVITLSATSNMTRNPRYAVVTLVGCYDTIRVNVTQAGNPLAPSLRSALSEIILYPNPVQQYVLDVYKRQSRWHKDKPPAGT